MPLLAHPRRGILFRKEVMINLNRVAQNGADKVVLDYAGRCLKEFEGDLNGAVCGVAYGGDVEDIGKLWKGRGKVYGFDTFIGHPKELVKDQTNFEATCMDYWYKLFGIYFLSAESIRSELDALGLDNTILIRGLIHKDSCKDIPYLNFVFIDLDIAVSMETAYQAVKDKIVKGGYLLLHDVVPPSLIPATNNWYTSNKFEGFKVIDEITRSYVAVLQKV